MNIIYEYMIRDHVLILCYCGYINVIYVRFTPLGLQLREEGYIIVIQVITIHVITLTQQSTQSSSSQISGALDGAVILQVCSFTHSHSR